jgi:hypothetical protein
MLITRACLRCALSAAAAAGIAIPLMTAAPASAATVIKTEIINLTVTPGTINYADREVTISGQLVETADPSTGLSGETINFSDGLPQYTGSLTTGTNGTFSGTVDLAGPDDVWAFFDTVIDGSTVFGGSLAHTAIAVTELPVRVSLTTSTTQAWAGSDFTVSGVAQIQYPDGTWELLPNAAVREPVLGVLGVGGIGSYTGTYSYTATASGTQNYQVELLPDTDNAGRAWYGSAYSGTVKVITRYHTRITGFRVSCAHRTCTISGTVQTWDGRAWQDADGLDVDLQYRYSGSSTWHSAETIKASSTGHFSTTRKMSTGNVAWRAWVPYQSDNDNYAPSAAVTSSTRVTS